MSVPHSSTPWKLSGNPTCILDAQGMPIADVRGTNEQSFATAAYIVRCVNTTKWPESTCVECGKEIPAGQMQECSLGGFCSHRVPPAVRAFMEFPRV